MVAARAPGSAEAVPAPAQLSTAAEALTAWPTRRAARLSASGPVAVAGNTRIRERLTTEAPVAAVTAASMRLGLRLARTRLGGGPAAAVLVSARPALVLAAS